MLDGKQRWSQAATLTQMLQGTSAPAVREATRLPLSSGGTTSSEGGRPGFISDSWEASPGMSTASALGQTLSPFAGVQSGDGIS